MSKFDKFKEILGVALPIAGGLIPGASALTKVSDILTERHGNGLADAAAVPAIQELAKVNDRQDEMIFTMAQEIAAVKLQIAELKK